MDKHYDPSDIEKKWFPHWEKSGAFKSGRRPDAQPYCIVIPPPNVTGSLHVGHALNNTLQDVLCRFERLRGKDVLWQPGVDHAGIATQMVVERQLAAEGLDRRDMGREAFLERVWKWKEESGGTIENQLKRLGSSADWSRSRFTMDEGLSKAVVKVFVQYHREGLIYRDKRLVNWDPKFRTAISDLEVEQREVDGNFWHLAYPVDGSDERIIVATTRPETMLGDTAVAVHPEDDRYRHLVGKMVRLPLTDRLIPIIADEHADPEQGSGAVKITPAHDFNDFEVGKRNDLEMINIFDQHAAINENAPEKYRGMSREEARKAVVADLDALGVLVKIEPKCIMMPYGDRSGVVIEPWLTDQWYVDAKTLAGPAIEAVRSGKTKFVPGNWEKTYYQWMENIQPWCISRQLWWGHQIPAWYGPDGTVYVAESEEEAQAQAGEGVALTRDEDVLDTWFSSALWPFSTLGWPEDTPDVKRFYPTATLVTAFDIIFFWVARMMMSGLHFMNEVPFKDVYITSLVRDEKGDKMSKSKGNVIDPLDFINKYGADALRFTMASLETQGRDIKLSESRVEGYRNFGTKLWNAARFCEMNGIGGSRDLAPPPATLSVNRWIIGEIGKAAELVTKSLEAFRFDAAANAIYHFTWGTFCDWYLELIKPTLMGEDGAEKDETRAVAGWVLDQILVLLHPFMPFITEELWHALFEGDRADLIEARWPVVRADAVDAEADAELTWIVDLISATRSARSEANIPAGAKVSVLVQETREERLSWLARNGDLILRLGRLASITPTEHLPNKGAVQFVMDGASFAIPLEGVIDLGEERARLDKAIAKTEKEINALSGRLSNEKFVANAPDEVVAEARNRLEQESDQLEKLKAAKARLG
ncbi:valine--tRNA ligase [Iodidimonas gelatinilytica]|uniref:Valine--tRNA ligase n=1 Tax=Iodidimonas gelatinilytica TaxID=1236966 RepID=A0A5A7MTD2_9PROT|nr:valine--tRNA ligase [Iodidimonas gelatinilytica]GEQ98248.1 valine--tRNA ligase [Iodidimonas gelatinilytica]